MRAGTGRTGGAAADIGGQGRQWPSSNDALLVLAMKTSGKRQADVAWKATVLFSKSEKNPFVFEKIESGRDVPEGRQDIVNLPPDAPQFPVETPWVVDVFDGVGTKDPLKLLIAEGQAVNVANEQEVGDVVAVFDDVRIDAAAVRLAAADIEVPTPPMENPGFQQSVAQAIEKYNRHDRGDNNNEE